MISYISVFLFPDTISFLKNNSDLITKIEKDTHTTIKIIAKKYDPSVNIDGQFEDVHKARIILQELEKNNYREAYINKNYN
tara:strand:+ start:363 stop:605 length:243 start_codon:yes stop_codon:yes gene_type:complete